MKAVLSCLLATVAGGIMLSASLLFGGLALTVVTIKD